jgi:GNAT superfamily N-acetyltransferase
VTWWPALRTVEPSCGHPIRGRTTCRSFDALEVVTIDALTAHRGVRTALLTAARRRAEDLGCHRLWLITTNDNLAALRFHQRRGMRLTAVHVGAADAARQLKAIPHIGENGIPKPDELELAIELPGP